METLKHNILQLLIAIDQLFNVIIGIVFVPHKKSYADETLSSRCWRASLAGYDTPRKIIDFVFSFRRNHCKESFESERLGRKLPPECRL